MPRLIVVACLILGFAPVAPKIADAASRGWNGRYHYDFDGGRTMGGSAIAVAYTLVLTPGSCRFTARGFQTDEDIVCTARATPDRLEVAFRRYGDGGTTDRYGNVVYAVGDTLFALERRGDRVITRWKGYTLPDEKPHRPAVYFTR